MTSKKFSHAGILLLLILPFSQLSGQENNLDSLEQGLVESYQSIMDQDQYHRDNKAFDFFHQFLQVLQQSGTYDYPFDKLKHIGKIYSPDHHIRVYTWNIPVGMDGDLYFGCIQYYAKNDKVYRIVPLHSNGTDQTVDSLKWHGALYYEIVESKHAGQKYYTLLGFDFNTAFSNKKVIDIIAIDPFGELYFPKDLFFYNNKPMDRIVFEYNEQARMILRYDKSLKMIVFDHLAPDKPSQEGNYQFYGPDMTSDGLKFEKGVWVQYKNVIVKK